MKYLLTIFSIICLATLVTIYFLWPEKQVTEGTVAMTINGHNFSKQAIKTQGEKSGYHSDEHGAILESIITKELLIQEAKRQKIDQEEPFRTSLKNFYEQSLINTLLDRQYAKVQVTVVPEEIEAYSALFGKKVTFTRLPVSNSPPYTPTSNGESSEVLFDDLAESIQISLAELQPGQFEIKFDTGSERYALRLDKITPVESSQPHIPDQEYIKQILEENKRQKHISSWLENLRKDASITIHSQ